MSDIDINGRKIEIDGDGFLVDPVLWTEDIAAYLAPGEGIDKLTDEHWKAIRYVRNYYKQFEIAPRVKKLCEDTGNTIRSIYDLFPTGPAKGTCKLAGLPKPTGCV